MCKIYFITLSKDTPSPFAPENIQADVVENNENDASKEKEENEKQQVTIDFENIQSRIIELPVNASNYSKISAIGNHVYYYEKSTHNGALQLKMYDLDKKEETVLGKGLHYTISPKHNKMLVKDNGNYAVIDMPTSSINMSDPVDLAQMKMYVNYDKEWEQIFEESWRQMRDFFYVENMHGVNWNKMKEKYNKLVPYANHRDDLTYIIGEMIGELNVGHAYVQSGEKPETPKINTGLLGAVIEQHSSGFFQIKNILKGASWSKKLRSPLQEIGLDVENEEFILAINGINTNQTNNIYSLLIGKAGEEVELTINNKPSFKGSRKIVVKPIDDESPLYYHQWVQSNIEKVNQATNGDVGYLHIPDMLSEGLNEFVEYYYPQIRKKGLIIDIRGNGGGYVSPMIIERLRRENIRAKMTRNVEEGQPHPTMTLQGPMVMLIDHYTASDGDLMAYAFREHKLGELIGTRTWGGVVGITGSLPFIDGGSLRKPEYASYSAKESKWIIEGKGVEPDIHVENDPHQEYLGNDAQLKKAIGIIINKVKNEYKPVPPIPDPPVKNGDNKNE
jgi:tricorn protease